MPVLASLVALVSSPELMALITVAVLIGAAFGAMPGIGPKTAPVSTATVISAMSSGELTRATRLARTGTTLAPS